METIEIIARALIIDKDTGKILFCTTKNKSYYYLPGGHVEFGESAVSALSRELLEETGTEIHPETFSFAGANENVFEQEGEPRHEINLYFRVENIFSSDTEVISKEDHISFEWVSFNELSQFPILPKSLPAMLCEWMEGKSALWKNI